MQKVLTKLLSACPSLGIILLTGGVFLFTKNPLTARFSLHFTLLFLLVFFVYIYHTKKIGKPVRETKSFFYLAVVLVLFLVASTGWFFSPFFFCLYLLAIFLAFVFPPSVAFGFVFTLVGLFSFNIGEIDLAYDFLVVLSLLTVLPLSFYLKREYLRLREADKKILVLEKDGQSYPGKIEEILDNKINNFSVNLRQPLNDIKQLAYWSIKEKQKEEIDKNRERIIASVEQALRMLKGFEEESTGKKLLSNPENL